MIFGYNISIILACIIVYCFIWIYRKKPSSYETGKALPGPKTYPIIGSIYYWKCLFHNNANEYLNCMNSLTNNYPSPCGFWLSNKLIVYVSDPGQIKTVLRSTKCLNKSPVYTVFEPWLGTGLLTAPASIWQTRRKIIAPNFNMNMLRQNSDALVKHFTILMDELATIKEDEVDLFNYIMKYNLDALYDTTFGIDLGQQSNINYQLLHALNKIKKIIQLRVQYLFLYPDFIFNLTPLKHKQQQYLEFIHSIATKVMHEKENKKRKISENESGKIQERVLLDALIEKSQVNKAITQDDILDEINTFFIAGSDTTAITLYFVIYMLANFSKIQEKVYEELLGIYGKQDIRTAPVKFDDLQSMNYLERVIKETLRIFPVAPFIGREVTEDLNLGPHVLPKGSSIGIAILNVHRNEKYWPNAMSFDPDRFLPENSANRHPYCYLPFSEGSRSCIGRKYAMVSMKIFLATLMRTFVLQLDKNIKIDEIKLKVEVMLFPIKPFKIKLRRRNLGRNSGTPAAEQ